MALGFSTTKRAPISSSEKSITAFARKGSETASTSTFWPSPFQHQIVGGRIVQRDVILKARTAAALDRHAQRLCLAGAVGDLGQPGKGAVGDFGRQGQRTWRFPVSIRVAFEYMVR